MEEINQAKPNKLPFEVLPTDLWVGGAGGGEWSKSIPWMPKVSPFKVQGKTHCRRVTQSPGAWGKLRLGYLQCLLASSISDSVGDPLDLKRQGKGLGLWSEVCFVG